VLIVHSSSEIQGGRWAGGKVVVVVVKGFRCQVMKRIFLSTRVGETLKVKAADEAFGVVVAFFVENVLT